MEKIYERNGEIVMEIIGEVKDKEMLELFNKHFGELDGYISYDSTGEKWISVDFNYSAVIDGDDEEKYMQSYVIAARDVDDQYCLVIGSNTKNYKVDSKELTALTNFCCDWINTLGDKPILLWALEGVSLCKFAETFDGYDDDPYREYKQKLDL